jgi:hypothetical protein
LTIPVSDFYQSTEDPLPDRPLPVNKRDLMVLVPDAPAAEHHALVDRSWKSIRPIPDRPRTNISAAARAVSRGPSQIHAEEIVFGHNYSWNFLICHAAHCSTENSWNNCLQKYRELGEEHRRNIPMQRQYISEIATIANR